MADEDVAGFTLVERVFTDLRALPRMGPVHPNGTPLALVEDLETPPPRDVFPLMMRASRRRLVLRVLTHRGAAARDSAARYSL